jgi:hypothetical protein
LTSSPDTGRKTTGHGARIGVTDFRFSARRLAGVRERTPGRDAGHVARLDSRLGGTHRNCFKSLKNR